MTRSPMTRLLTRRALRTFVGLLVLVEAVFVTDVMTTELERVIEHGGSAWDFLRIIAYKMPEVVDFALPIVLFLGIYFAVTGARAQNELLICAASGEPWQRIPRLALGMGAVAMAVSLLFSGLVFPYANHLLRLTFHELTVRMIVQELTDPDAQVEVRELAGRTFIASPSATAAGTRGSLFIHSDAPGGGWRVARADDWVVEGPDAAGGYELRLDAFREYRGDAPGAAPATGGGRPSLDLSRIRVAEMSADFSLDDIIAAPDRSKAFRERFLFDEGGPLDGAAIALPDGSTAASPTRRFGEMLSRALLCPIAAALALAGAAFAGTRRGRLLGLPLGLVAVMVVDVASRALLGDAAGLGYALFWPAAGALFLLGLAPALAYVWTRGELIVAPPRTTQ